MKKGFLYLITLAGVLLSGCSKGFTDEIMTDSEKNALYAQNSAGNTAGITVKAADVDKSTGNILTGDTTGTVVFTTEDILWYNETTKELRFKDNTLIKASVLSLSAISFFLFGEYLFSSMVYVSDSNTPTYYGLVFYYNKTENKYFLISGSELFNHDSSRQPADVAPSEAASDWNKFIDQLKKEGRYKN